MPAMSAQQLAVVVWPDELVERHGTALQPDAPAGTLPRPYPHVNSRNRMAAFGRTNIGSWLASVKAPLKPVRAAAAQQLCSTTPREPPHDSPHALVQWLAAQGIVVGAVAGIPRWHARRQTCRPLLSGPRPQQSQTQDH